MPSRSRPRSTAVASTDAASAVIVGGGVLGASLGARLAGDGWAVTLVEQHGSGDRRGASWSRSRHIRFAHGAAIAETRSAREALGLWREIERAAEAELMVETGMAWFAHDDDAWEADSQKVLAAEGIPFERIEPSDARRLFPDLGTSDLRYVLLEPEACVIHAERSVRALCGLALAAGARTITARARPAGSAVEVDGRRLTADRIVWACGSWMPTLFPDLLAGAVIQQDLYFFAVPPAWRTPGIPAFGEGDGSASGVGDLLGTGLKVGADRPGPELDPDAPREPDRAQENAARTYLSRRFPAIADAPLMAVETCQTTVLGRELQAGVRVQAGQRMLEHPDHSGVWLLGDGSGSAFKHGPAIARTMEMLLEDGIAPEACEGGAPVRPTSDPPG